MMARLTFLFLISLQIATNAQENKPVWIDHPEKNYPSSDYLVAVGTGDSRKEAENVALANLSKIFESNIKLDETINSRYSELIKSESQSSLENKTDVNKQISVSSNQILYNVRYPEAFTDNLGKVYVLAVLEREPTAEIYMKSITDNERRIYRLINSGNDNSDPLKKYAYYEAANVVSQVNNRLINQMRIINPGYQYADTLNNPDKINELCKSAQERIPFVISVRGNDSDKVIPVIAGAVNQLGFPVAQKGALKIQCSERVEEIDLNRPEKFVRWSYEFSILDSTGKVIISALENGREGHVTYGEAVARGQRTMNERITAKLKREIMAYFDKLVRE
ncbi:MAG: LPP20 family lipoprotein [Candidatus Kryptoniota bacterium]